MSNSKKELPSSKNTDQIGLPSTKPTLTRHSTNSVGKKGVRLHQVVPDRQLKLDEYDTGQNEVGSDEKVGPRLSSLAAAQDSTESKINHDSRDIVGASPSQRFQHQISRLEGILRSTEATRYRHLVSPVKLNNIPNLSAISICIESLLNQNFIPDPLTITTWLTKLGEWKNINEAWQLYNVASLYSVPPNPQIFNVMIKIAGENSRVDLAEFAFQEALTNSADAETFNTRLDIAIRNQDFSKSQQVYSEAIESKKANLVTHCMASRFGLELRIPLEDKEKNPYPL